LYVQHSSADWDDTVGGDAANSFEKIDLVIEERITPWISGRVVIIIIIVVVIIVFSVGGKDCSDGKKITDCLYDGLRDVAEVATETADESKEQVPGLCPDFLSVVMSKANKHFKGFRNHALRMLEELYVPCA
jgi:hypothetical protein